MNILTPHPALSPLRGEGVEACGMFVNLGHKSRPQKNFELWK